MRQFDRIYRLYQVIRARRRPVPMAVLRERLECSESTVKRAIRDLRVLGAPLEYDAERRGYFFDDRGPKSDIKSDSKPVDYLCFDDTMDKDWVSVTEVNKVGSVPTLLLDNRAS